MFLALLKFSKGKNRAGELMAAHNAWIERGFDDGVFLVVGSLQPGLGGIVVVDKVARDELEKRLESDPFVVHDVVKVELLEVLPSKTDPRLRFLSS